MRFNANLGGHKNLPADPHTAKRYADLESVLNNNIEFGEPANGANPGTPGNIKGSWVMVVTPPIPDTDFTIQHNLGTVPVGIDIKQKNVACDVYNGSVPHTKATATLRATAGNAQLTLFVH